MKNTKKVLIIAISAIVIIATTVCVLFNTGVFNPLEHQLKLGSKYLDEGKYEEAILAFEKALEIDPKNETIFATVAELYAEHYSVDELIDFFKKQYGEADDSVYEELCIISANKYIENEKYGDALSLLKEIYQITNSELLKDKIIQMYRDKQFEDVIDKMDSVLKDDFSKLIEGISSSADVLQNENGYSTGGMLNGMSTVSEREAIFYISSGLMNTYLSDKNKSIETEYTEIENGVQYTKFPIENADWVLKNIFNIEPSHKYTSNEGFGDKGVFIRENVYYAPMIGLGTSSPSAKIDKVYNIDNNIYYFEYREHFPADGVLFEDDFTSDIKQYALVEWKKQNGLEFWSIIETSTENEIDLTKYAF